MQREKALVKNTLVLGIGKFLPKLAAFITLPIITARLSKAEVGTYDLILTLIALLIPIATLQIQSAAFRFLIDSRGDEKRSSEIITNIWFVTLPISLIVSVGIGIYYSIVNSIEIGVLAALCFVADILFMTLSQIARGLSMNAEYSLSSIFISVVNLVGIFLMVQLMDGALSGVLLSLVLANLAGVLFLAFKIKIFRFLHLSLISSKQMKEMIGYSWPMVPNNLSTWVLNLSDRMVITFFWGVEANAVYAVANKIPAMLLVAQSVFVMAWHENASITVKDADAGTYYTGMFDRCFSLIAGATGLIIGMIPVFFAILIRGDYDEAYRQIPLLIVGMCFYCMSSFQGGIYIAHKKTKSVGLTTLFAAAINLTVNLLFVRFIGITAASVSTLVAYLALYLFRMKDVLKFQPINYNIAKQILVFAVFFIMIVLGFFNTFPGNVMNALIGVVLFVWLNKELLCKIASVCRAKISH